MLAKEGDRRQVLGTWTSAGAIGMCAYLNIGKKKSKKMAEQGATYDQGNMCLTTFQHGGAARISAGQGE